MMSPGCATCPLSTDFVTLILTYGFFADDVRWQIVVFVGFAAGALWTTGRNRDDPHEQHSRVSLESHEFPFRSIACLVYPKGRRVRPILQALYEAARPRAQS